MGSPRRPHALLLACWPAGVLLAKRGVRQLALLLRVQVQAQRLLAQRAEQPRARRLLQELTQGRRGARSRSSAG